MQQTVKSTRGEKHQRGFTLYEMMIVLGLIIVLTTATAVYNRGIGSQIILAREHAKVLGIFIRARSAGFTNPTVSLADPICGYGVHIDAASRTMVFFKDFGVAGIPCGTSANNHYDGASEQIDQVSLDPGMDMKSDASDVVFVPPFGKVVIDGVDTRTAATVTVSSTDAGVTKQVKVNIYGQITE